MWPGFEAMRSCLHPTAGTRLAPKRGARTLRQAQGRLGRTRSRAADEDAPNDRVMGFPPAFASGTFSTS